MKLDCQLSQYTHAYILQLNLSFSQFKSSTVRALTGFSSLRLSLKIFLFFIIRSVVELFYNLCFIL